MATGPAGTRKRRGPAPPPDPPPVGARRLRITTRGRQRGDSAGGRTPSAVESPDVGGHHGGESAPQRIGRQRGTEFGLGRRSTPGEIGAADRQHRRCGRRRSQRRPRSPHPPQPALSPGWSCSYCPIYRREPHPAARTTCLVTARISSASTGSICNSTGLVSETQGTSNAAVTTPGSSRSHCAPNLSRMACMG